VPQGWSLLIFVHDVINKTDVKNRAMGNKKSSFLIIQKAIQVKIIFTKIGKIYCDKQLIY